MTRRTAALQAYYDWMPIREDAQTREEKIYRSFRFGNMATLMMLDTRLIGRDQQMPPEDSAAAESQARGVAPHFNYVSVVTDRCPPEQRMWLIEMLWEVAYADGELHALESNLLRRIGGLLHVTDVEVGAARKRVLQRMGLPEGTGVWE